MGEQPMITLSTLMEGAAEELFQNAFKNALANLQDPNTDPKAARKFTLTFTLRADEKRANPVLTVGCVTKLASIRPNSTPLLIGMHNGELAAREPFRQEDMFTTPHGRPEGIIAGNGGH